MGAHRGLRVFSRGSTNRDDHQTQALEAFRTELTAEGLIPANRDEMTKQLGYDRFDDQTLLRFLRARKFDLPKSKLMWETNEKWRKDFGADDIAACVRKCARVVPG